MTEPTDDRSLDAAAEAARRRRRAEVFGDVLPEATSDDLDDSSGSSDGPDGSAPGQSKPSERARETWLRREVPPHHL